MRLFHPFLPCFWWDVYIADFPKRAQVPDARSFACPCFERCLVAERAGQAAIDEVYRGLDSVRPETFQHVGTE